MGQGLTGPHLIVLVFLVVLLFGAPKLPMLAKSLGQSMKILKNEVRADDDQPAREPVAAEPSKPGDAGGAN
ncbi:twin-arginine translocase TatA/TatE family subunit [Leucobacter komagatae]|uniref:Sec-independent protein translocase protein TatA n=1 Tax=Leucobacter komagatae TaxID=55969 RepID=A0A0D0HYT9_9MICO|nr:twin-arginine translocase TatA/TatE family subunit [Leucobacter komagatae]KIP52766.1 hypothetical protein SD72_07370 [Leucobacter komagatae]